MLNHDIFATGPRSRLTIATDSSSASLGGFSPFSGTLVYASPQHNPNGSSGTITHGVNVKFDSVGVKAIPSGVTAQLEAFLR